MNKIERLLNRFINKAVHFLLWLQAKMLIKHGKDFVFFNHIMDPSWNYKPYVHKINPYFKKYGFEYSTMEGEYYKELSGVESDLYIPQTFFYYYLYPFLNRAGYRQDKNMMRKLLGEKSSPKKVEFIMPRQIIYNMEGVFYTSDDEMCSVDDAVSIIMNYSDDIIVKPATNTTWGKGVVLLLNQEKTEKKIRELFSQYKKDFLFEEKIIQHSDLAAFNETSLNTIRIVTYRKLSGEIKFLFALQRFGGPGSVVDNASAGGGFVALSEEGYVDRTIRNYKSIKTKRLDESFAERIPYFQKLKEVAVHLHTRLPYLNYIGWDMSVTQGGIPVLIEFNTMPAVVAKQMSSGPVFCKEDLDEIMPKIAQWSLGYNCFPTICFPNRKEYRGRIR